MRQINIFPKLQIVSAGQTPSKAVLSTLGKRVQASFTPGSPSSEGENIWMKGAISFHWAQDTALIHSYLEKCTQHSCGIEELGDSSTLGVTRQKTVTCHL